MEGHAQKMRGTILRFGEQKDRAIVQSRKPLLGRPSNQKRKCLNHLENCLKYAHKLS